MFSGWFSQSTPEEDFLTAVREGRIKKVRELLKSNSELVNIVDKEPLIHKGEKLNNDVITPLITAIFKGYTEIAELLIEYGANVNVRNKTDTSPLQLAALSGNDQLVNLLLKKGANINSVNKNGDTALNQAILRGHPKIAKLLIEKGASVNVKDNNGHCTPLHNALAKGYTDLCTLLIEKNADVNAQDKDGFTPLAIAVVKNHVELAKLLILRGASVNFRYVTTTTLLHESLLQIFFQLTELLINKGADVNAQDKDGFAPLHICAENGSDNDAKLLIEKDANVNIEDSDGDTPLHFAARFGKIGMVKILIDNGANVNAQNKNGDTPLHFAGNPYIRNLLIEKGADLNITNLQGIKPLTFAHNLYNLVTNPNLNKIDTQKKPVITAAPKKKKKEPKVISNNNNNNKEDELTKFFKATPLTQEQQEQLTSKFGREALINIIRTNEINFLKVIKFISAEVLLEQPIEKLHDLFLFVPLLEAKTLSSSEVIYASKELISLVSSLKGVAPNISLDKKFNFFMDASKADAENVREFLQEHSGEHAVVSKLELVIAQELLRDKNEKGLNLLIANSEQLVFGLACHLIKTRDHSFTNLFSFSKPSNGQIFDLLKEAISENNIDAFSQILAYYPAQATQENMFKLLKTAQDKDRDSLPKKIISLLEKETLEFVKRQAEKANNAQIKNLTISRLNELKKEPVAPVKEVETPKKERRNSDEKKPAAPAKSSDNKRSVLPKSDSNNNNNNNPPITAPSKTKPTKAETPENNNNLGKKAEPTLTDADLPRKEAPELKPRTIEMVKKKIVKIEQREASAPPKPEKEEVEKDNSHKAKIDPNAPDASNLLKIAHSSSVFMEDAYKHIIELKRTIKKEDLSTDPLYKEYVSVLKYNLVRFCEALTQCKGSRQERKILNRVMDINVAEDIRDSIRHDLSLLSKEDNLLKLAKNLIPDATDARLSSRLSSILTASPAKIKLPMTISLGNHGFSMRNKVTQPLSDEALIDNIRTEFKNIDQFYKSYCKPKEVRANAAEAMKMSICMIGVCLKALSPRYAEIKSLNCFDIFRRLGNKVAHIGKERFFSFKSIIPKEVIEEIGKNIQPKADFFDYKINEIAKIKGPYTAQVVSNDNNNAVSNNNNLRRSPSPERR